MRADARRNYDRLVAAAREIFDEHGAAAPLDDVARHAGIGNATMYRHFPTRRDLLVAVYADEVTALCDEGEALLEASSPADALFGWLRSFITHVAAKRDLALAIDGPRSRLFEDWHDSMHATASDLLTRAQRAGAVRADLTVTDLLALANGIALTSTDADQTRRLLRFLRQGTAAQAS